jgi:hypothetical protein
MDGSGKKPEGKGKKEEENSPSPFRKGVACISTTGMRKW